MGATESLPGLGGLSQIWGRGGRCPAHCSFTCLCQHGGDARGCPEKQLGVPSVPGLSAAEVSVLLHLPQLQTRRGGKAHALQPHRGGMCAARAEFPPSHAGTASARPRRGRRAPAPPSPPASLFQRCQKEVGVRGAPPDVSCSRALGLMPARWGPTLHPCISGVLVPVQPPPSSASDEGHGARGGWFTVLSPPRPVSGGYTEEHSSICS